MITEEQIKTLADRFHIDTYSILREYIQLLFLKYFYEPRGSENIYFKGGTAIHFLFGSFRFSEDLDFTSLLPASDLKKILESVMRKLENEVPGANLVSLGTKPHGLAEIIKYQYGLRHPLTIRLEFSLREKPMTRQVSPVETPFPVSAYPLVVHMQGEELLAEKVRALLTRHKGRDLFDLWFLLSKEIRLRKDYIQEKMRWYRSKYEFLDLVDSIKKFDEKTLMTDLGKFLPKNYRSFIRELKNRTLEKLGTPQP